MSYARNHVTRPPHNDPSNWLMHETWTTDGSGWVSSGFADSVVPGGVCERHFDCELPHRFWIVHRFSAAWGEWLRG